MSLRARIFSLLTLASLVASGNASSVLFVGNSFTQSAGNAGQAYNAAAITDANGTGIGGVPGIFKKLAMEGGFLEVNVTVETNGGQTLAFHLATESETIGSQAWDWVVLQEYSTRPLLSASGDANGTNIAAFRSAISEIKNLTALKNSSTRLLLYETWARPDKIAAGYFPNLASMQNELRSSYSAAANDLGLQGWAPVGDAFLQGIAAGLANDPTTAFTEGPVSLWNSDNYHASAYGSYLAANVFYAKILGGDPRALPTGAGSAVAGLGLNSVYADQLQEIAYKLTQPVPEPSTGLLCGIGLLLSQMRRRRRSNSKSYGRCSLPGC
jgi:hypothetical protein